MSRDVAHDNPELSGRQREHVVPVAANRLALSGNVTRREFEARTGRQPFGQEAALEQPRRRAFDRQRPGLGSPRDAIGDDFEEFNVSIVERSVL